ncbi:hypothetical protein [Paraliomyxa miuraensis]|uniref:hypothetical protein n=1 Tax=Paraliomyxa miuraensis TaxID=376150 RepID=UPI00224DA69B|nr:hypothetical protein [Paraliomyxa miuraensis]MCX4240546.1 hypothetical protein [Paraliomyxa miuraensis]
MRALLLTAALVGACGAPDDRQPCDAIGAPMLPPEPLPTLGASDAADLYIQRLPEPTTTGLDVAIHYRVGPMLDPALEGSLVVVVGEQESPLALFESDMLARAGRIPESPGPGFHTLLASLEPMELERVANLGDSLEQRLGPSEGPSSRFEGRSMVAHAEVGDLDLADGEAGGLVMVPGVVYVPPALDVSHGRALMITHPAVVQDPTRTADPCRPGPGNPDGAWTFKHLMKGVSGDAKGGDMTKPWLEQWSKDWMLDGDDIPERKAQMHGRVLDAWPRKSGGVELDLDQAPLRLAAIVNRVDLGTIAEDGSGPGYGGTIAAGATTAGELRFVFGVQDPATCEMLPFSVIFEYRVPISDCEGTRAWAKAWLDLDDPSAAFSEQWREQLEILTESVVASSAGTPSLLHLRTNEDALAPDQEMRSFELVTNGPNVLAREPLDMTPSDSLHDTIGDADVANFVDVIVKPTLSVGGCRAAFSLPGWIGLHPGGNVFVSETSFWGPATLPVGPAELCAWHRFSLETCNGCHGADTGTSRFHVDPRTMPATLSRFLTGGAPHSHSTVADPRDPTRHWSFAELTRRYQALQLAAGRMCGGVPQPGAGFLNAIAALGPVPVSSSGPNPGEWELGPVHDEDTALAMFDAFLDLDAPMQIVSLRDFVREAETFVH